MEDAHARYKELVEEYDSIIPDYGRCMFLASNISGDKMGRNLPALLEQKLEEVGEYRHEDIWGNREKLRVGWDGKFAPRESVEDWERECEIVLGFIAERKAVKDYYTKQYAILREWKESNLVTIDGDAKEKIEALARELHNEELTKESHVKRVWDDGLIDSQKGGELYECRSVFMMKAAVNVTGLTFPVIEDECSYAIVTDADAERIRDAIIAAMLTLTQSR